MEQLLFWGIIVLGAVFTKLPVIGKFVRVCNTLVHEVGHAFMSLLSGGGVQKIDLFSNTSGAAVTTSPYWLSKFLVALAGYVFSSFFAFASLFFIRYGNYYLVIYSLLFLCFLSLIFWVRNKYGIFWIVLFVLLSLIFLKYGTYDINYYFAVFICGVLLLESVYTSMIVMYLSFTDHYNSGDAYHLSEFAVLPAFVWGLFFFAQALFWIWQGALLYFPMVDVLK